MARLNRTQTALGLTISFVSFVSFVSPSFSQKPPQNNPAPTTTPTAPGGNTGSTTNPGRNPFPGTNPTQTNPNDQMNRFPEEQRPIFLSGKVMLDDGTPAESVVIERVCNGNPRAEAYT